MLQVSSDGIEQAQGQALERRARPGDRARSIRSMCPTPCSTGKTSLVAPNSTHSSHAGSVTSRSFLLCTVQRPWMKSKACAAGVVMRGPSHRPPTIRRITGGSGRKPLYGCSDPADHRAPWSSRWSSNRIRRRIRRTASASAGSCATSCGPSTWTRSQPVDGGPAPPGRRESGLALTEWLVTLSGGGGVFVSVIGTIKAWLGGRAGAHKVTVTIDGDTLELSSATAEERAELVETFVRRHQPA